MHPKSAQDLLKTRAQPFAISYMRFSSPQQAKGDSKRRQLRMATDWSERTGVPINETIRDFGVSGFRGKNTLDGNLRRFLDLVEVGQIPRGTYLLVENLDRLSRDAVFKAFSLFTSLINAGIRIVSLSDGIEYSEEILKTQENLLYMWLGTAIRAHNESAIKSDRINKLWVEKRTQAAATGAVMSRVLPAWLKATGPKGKLKIEVDADRVAVVQRIFRMTIDGYGRRGIVQILNREKVPTFRSGKTWQPSYIIKILTSRGVLGEIQPHARDEKGVRRPTGPALKDYYPAIVSEDDFYRAAAAIASRRRAAGRRGPEVANIFQGLGRCGCGASMAVLNKGAPPKGSRYFACSANIRAAGCERDQRWRVDRIEKEVLDRAVQIDWSSALASHAVSQFQLEEKEVLIKGMRQQRDRMNELAVAGDDTMMARSKELTKEIKKHEAVLAKLKRERREEESRPSPERQSEIIAEIRAQLDGADDTARHELRTRMAQVARWSIERICFSDEVNIVFRGGINETFHEKREQSAGGRRLPRLRNTIVRSQREIEEILAGHEASDAEAQQASALRTTKEARASAFRKARKSAESADR